MRIRSSTKDIWLIGDPHLGKVFQTDVPLNRRGEREAMQMAEFKRQLEIDCDINIMVGDLFDKPVVSLNATFEVAEAYISAAIRNANRTYVVLAGNHDRSRQTQSTDSFMLLALALERVPNIVIVMKPMIVHDIALFPWQWDVTAREQVEYLGYPLPSVAVGHWDLADFGGSLDHLVPARELVEMGVERIYGGHFHVAGSYVVDAVSIECTGSMLPMNHGEDPENKLYITLTLDELEGMDHSELKNMNVRVIVPPGVSLPEIDCLSLKTKIEGQKEEVELHEVGLGEFNLIEVMTSQFDQLEVPEPVRIFIKEKLGAGGQWN